MEIDQEAKKAVRKLVKAINSAIEKDVQVLEAIEDLRELGFEPQLNVKLEIGLQGNEEFLPEDPAADDNLRLTDEDLRTLRRMKIKF